VLVDVEAEPIDLNNLTKLNGLLFDNHRGPLHDFRLTLAVERYASLLLLLLFPTGESIKCLGCPRGSPS
jgi:hypothetical protein